MKIRIRPVFWGYLAAVALCSSLSSCVGLLIALSMHELGHYLAIRILHEPIDQIEIAPFGGVMTYHPLAVPSKGFKGIVLALAGPMGNYISMLIINLLPKSWGIDWMRDAMHANLGMLVMNMLPVLPLDGGTAVFCIGYYICRISVLIQVLSFMGIAAGGAGILLSIYGLYDTGKINLSLLVVCTYLIYAAWTQKNQMLIQNGYTIFLESQAYGGLPAAVQVYCVQRDSSVLEAMRCLRSSRRTVFLVEAKEGELEYVTDRMLNETLYENPAASVGDALKNITLKNKDKKNTHMP